LLITSVYIRFTIMTINILFFDIPDVNLIHQVSDKRLLERCGGGKGNLIETQSFSVRPSGLRTRRA